MAILLGMSRHAYHVLIYHVVFATKRRAPLLAEVNLQQVKDSLAAKSLAKIVGPLKGYSSRQNADLRWEIGYAAFTVSAVG